MAGVYTEEYLKFKFPSAPIFTGLCIILILIVLAIIVGIKARKADYKKPSKGLLMIVEWAVEKLDAFVSDTMGEGFDNFGGILLGVIPFLFLSFIIGLTALPPPIHTPAASNVLLIHFRSFCQLTSSRCGLHLFR